MSDSTTPNTPATILQQAKNRALKIIEQNQGCMSYVGPEDLATASLFIPTVSVIKPTREDFYDPIPGVGIMAKPQLVNLLKEKAGIEILRTDTEKRGEWVWKAHVFGQKRQPDGTMLPEDASYEFDAEKRAELDAINQPQKYGTEIAKRKHLLELAKFGEQRAVTGAQHALIHKLAHVARSFKSPEELMRGMIVCRVDRNIDGVLADPNMRAAALDHMLGSTEKLYGPEQKLLDAPPAKRTVDPHSGEVIEGQTAEGEEGQSEIDFDDEFPGEPGPKQTSPEDTARAMLQEFLDRKLPEKGGWKTACDLIRVTLADPKANLTALNSLIDRCNAYLQKQSERRTA